jgi:hypothetical protein
MKRLARAGPSIVATMLGCTLLWGCGGDDKPTPRPAVAAQIGDTIVSQRDVRRSIDVLFPHQGGYLKAFGPPRYPECVRQKAAAADAVRRLSATQIKQECKLEYGIARAQAVSFLVRAQWLSREAKRRGIQGAGMTKRLALVRSQADRQQHALLATVHVSNAAIANYAYGNADIYKDPEQRIVHIVQAKTRREAQQARALVLSGRGWKPAVERFGVKPLREHFSGTHRIRETNAPHDAFGRGMFSARVGALNGPVRTLNGWFIFQVVRVAKRGSNHLSAQARRTILHTLQSEQLDRALHARYAHATRCAKQYRIAEAPECRR